MSNETSNMVLRTIYLPRELDQKLKSAAIRGSRSKGDIIRELIAAGLEQKQKDTGSYYAEPSSERKPVKPTAPGRSLVLKGKIRTVTKKPGTGIKKATSG